jgi:hypothetical protein
MMKQELYILRGDPDLENYGDVLRRNAFEARLKKGWKVEFVTRCGAYVHYIISGLKDDPE